MFKVKIKRLFKLQPDNRMMKPDEHKIVELSKEEVDAINKQLGEDYILVIEEIKQEEEPINFNDMKVDEIKDWLKENEVEFSDEKKPELVELAEAKAEELEEGKK